MGGQKPLFLALSYYTQSVSKCLLFETDCTPVQISADKFREQASQVQERGQRMEGETGQNKATFVVRILYRENQSWQGQITWAETNETRPFRSVLELMKLMDSTGRPDKTGLGNTW